MHRNRHKINSRELNELLTEASKPNLKRERNDAPAQSPVIAAPKHHKKKAALIKAKAPSSIDAPTFIVQPAIAIANTHAAVLQELKTVETKDDLQYLADAAVQSSPIAPPIEIELEDIIDLDNLDRAVTSSDFSYDYPSEYTNLFFAIKYPNALHKAVNTGNMEQLAYLLKENNIPVDEADHAGFTPLYLAVLYNNIDAVKLLLEAGANKNYWSCEDLGSPFNLALSRPEFSNIYHIFVAHNVSLVPR